MNTDDVIKRLRNAPNRQVVADETGILYSYLCKLVYGEIDKPNSHRIDTLRDYFSKPRQ